mgnify:CR=1 FL=1
MKQTKTDLPDIENNLLHFGFLHFEKILPGSHLFEMKKY